MAAFNLASKMAAKLSFQVYLEFTATACSFQNKMATARVGVRGGRRENAGRKRKYDGSVSSQKGWNSQHKRIYLSMKIFEARRDAKTDAGYSLSSDSDFAAHLLSLEYRRR